MSEWAEIPLLEVAKVQQGYAFKSSDFNDVSGIPVIKIKNIASGKVNISETQFYAKEAANLSKYSIKRGDILIAMTGSHLDQPSSVVGRVSCYMDDKLCLLNQRTAKILPEKGAIDPQFLYYSLILDEILFILASNASGSANQANISSEQIYNLPLLCPPLPEQEAIAEVLSSLDDKIDLLHRNNKTLEQLDETLFRQWFVEEADETTVGDEFNVVMGQSPPGATYNEARLGITFYQGRTDFTFRIPTPRIYCTQPTRYAEKHDTLLSVRAPVGDINLSVEKCCIGRGIAAIRHKNPQLHYSYTYNCFKLLRELFDIHEDTGTIYGSINKDELLSMKCIQLNPGNIEFYNNNIGIIDDKILSNCYQIQHLEVLRDTLLPKLMNGVLKVNY